MLYKDKSKNIFADNKIISFSPHSCLATSPSETDTINIHVDKVIYIFFSILLQKEYGLWTMIELNVIVYVSVLTYFV